MYFVFRALHVLLVVVLCFVLSNPQCSADKTFLFIPASRRRRGAPPSSCSPLTVARQVRVERCKYVCNGLVSLQTSTTPPFPPHTTCTRHSTRRWNDFGKNNLVAAWLSLSCATAPTGVSCPPPSPTSRQPQATPALLTHRRGPLAMPSAKA